MNQELRTIISEYLTSHKLMTIATTEANRPWVANVYYLSDGLDVYFMSEHTTEHVQHIEINPAVAIAVNDASRSLQSPKIGLQASGVASRMTDEQTIRAALAKWNQKFMPLGSPETPADKFVATDRTTSLFKVQLHKVKFYNTELWPEDKLLLWSKLETGI